MYRAESSRVFYLMARWQTKNVLNRWPENGPRLAMFQIWPRPTVLRKASVWESEEDFQAVIPFFADGVNYDERLLASYLVLLGQGQISPGSLPWLINAS